MRKRIMVDTDTNNRVRVHDKSVDRRIHEKYKQLGRPMPTARERAEALFTNPKTV